MGFAHPYSFLAFHSAVAGRLDVSRLTEASNAHQMHLDSSRMNSDQLQQEVRGELKGERWRPFSSDFLTCAVPCRFKILKLF